MKTISVIIPCYNVEKYIDRCLTSLERQTVGMDSLEIICLDDKSADGTLDKLHEWEKKYPENICIVELPDNGRQGRARNIGLEYATCEWVAFIDSDDWVEPEYFEKLSAPVVGFGVKPAAEVDNVTEDSLTGKHEEGYVGAGEKVFDVIACGYGRDAAVELSYFSKTQGAGTPDAGSRGTEIDSSKSQLAELPSPEFRTVSAHTPEEHRAFFHEQKLDYAVYSKLIRRDFLISNQIFFPEGLTYEDIYWGCLVNMYAERACIIPDKLYHYFVNTQATLLTGDSDHHYDMLTVWEILWKEFIIRGLYDDYREEIELEFIYSCALAFWKIIALRFAEPPYSMYQLLCVFTRTHIPDIWSNRYVKAGVLPEFYTLILKSLYSPFAKDEFAVFAKQIKEIGI